MIDTPPVTEREGLRLSLKEILGTDFDRFLQDFVYKPIEEWANQGKIDVITLRRLNKLLKKHGNNIFDVPVVQLPYATKHTVEGGELFRVKLPVTKDLVIDNFMKIFSSEEAYKKAVDTQETVDNHFQGSDLEKIIVPLSFKNDKRLMVSYPMINASSFADVSAGMTDEQKEDTIKRIIDTYQRFSLDLTKNKDIFTDAKGNNTLDSLINVGDAFDKFFFSRVGKFSRNEWGHKIVYKSQRDEIKNKAIALISEYFKELNTGEDVIHKDLNPGNVLVSDEDIRIIDFEGLSKGFLEFDYAKLLTKSGLSPEKEEEIVEFAAKNKAKLEGRTASEKEIQASLRRYELNRIAQELFTAARYLKRSQPTVKHFYDLKKLRKVPHRGFSLPMLNMANVSYTLALRRMEKAVEKGIFPEEIKQCIIEYADVFKEGLRDLGDKLGEHLEKYNPHVQGSQENIASIQTLDAIVETNGKGIDKELGKLKKYIAKGKNKREWVRRAAYIGLPLALLVAAGAGILFYNQSRKAEVHEISYKRTDEFYNWANRIKDLHAVRKAPTSSNTIIDQRVLGHLYDKYKDKRTAELFYIDPKITMEAIWETGSEDYDMLGEYIRNNYVGFSAAISSQITGEGLVDNWAYTYSKEYFNKWYDTEVGAARKEYDVWVNGGRKRPPKKYVYEGKIIK